MNLLFVPPGGIQVEKRPQTKRTEQLPNQLGPVHMGTNGHMRGGRSFVSPLNLAMIDPLGGPCINMKGGHVGKDGNLQILRNGQRGSLLCLCSPSATDTRT